MNKNTIITILAVLVGVMATVLIVQKLDRKSPGDPTPVPPVTVTPKVSGADPGTNVTVTPKVSDAGVTNPQVRVPVPPLPTGSAGNTNNPPTSSTVTNVVDPTNIPTAPSPSSLTTVPPSVPPSKKSSPTVVDRELPPVKPGDVGRLPRKDEPQNLTSIFEVTGNGTLAAAAGAGDVSFYYFMKTVATSKIEDKEEFESGKIKVTEIRSFSEATEAMKVTNVNVRVDLSTVPVDAIANTGYLIGGIASLFNPEVGLSIAETVAEFRNTVDSFDGADAKPAFDLLKGFGIDVQRIISEPVEEYLKRLLDEVHSHVNAVTGKSYRFVYWTDKAGEPIRVRYENVDHSPISEAEQSVLNYVNLFIDCHILPDRNSRPGDSWSINPTSIGTMFGAVAGETCSGEVRVRRGNDLPDGNWSLSVDPATIIFYSKDRRPVGNVKIGGGKGIGDGRRAILRELQIDGKGKLRKKDSDTYLWFYEFITKTEGDCQFRSTISPRRDD